MKPPSPRLVGVVHLPPLPGSPRASRSVDDIARSVERDVRALERARFDAVILENFGDAPFMPDTVEPIVIAAMTRCVRAAREACGLVLGVNVLRNDAPGALAIAVAAGARFIRVNVHVGAVVADQGIIQGRAHETLRARRRWDAEHVAIWADVDVKHAAALAPRPLPEVAHDLVSRAQVDALLVTGKATGAKASLADVEAVVGASEGKPVYVASGATAEDLPSLSARGAYGVVVGSSLRSDGRAGGPIDRTKAARFARAFRKAFR